MPIKLWRNACPNKNACSAATTRFSSALGLVKRVMSRSFLDTKASSKRTFYNETRARKQKQFNQTRTVHFTNQSSQNLTPLNFRVFGIFHRVTLFFGVLFCLVLNARKLCDCRFLICGGISNSVHLIEIAVEWTSVTKRIVTRAVATRVIVKTTAIENCVVAKIVNPGRQFAVASLYQYVLSRCLSQV